MPGRPRSTHIASTRSPLAVLLTGLALLGACAKPPAAIPSSSAPGVPGGIATPPGVLSLGVPADPRPPLTSTVAGRSRSTAAAPAPSPAPRSAPAAASIPEPDPNGDLGDPALRAQISQALHGRGWRPVGIVGGAESGEPDFVLALTEEATRAEGRVTVWVLHLLSSEHAARMRHAAVASQVQIQCGARTLQALRVVAYRDRALTDRASEQAGTDSVLNIRTGSESDLLAQRLCGPVTNTGSAVVVGPQFVLTNAHVIQDCQRVQALRDRERMDAKVRASDSGADLALLHVPGLSARANRIVEVPRLRRSATIGEPILAAGYPLAGLLGHDIVVTTGIVNALAGLNADPTRLQVSAPVQPGNSGGPLLDKSGQLVGLVTSRLNALAMVAQTGTLTENVNFAIKPEALKAFLDRHRVPMAMADVGPALAPETLAQRGAAVTLKLECGHGGRPEDAAMGVSRRLSQ